MAKKKGKQCFLHLLLGEPMPLPSIVHQAILGWLRVKFLKREWVSVSILLCPRNVLVHWKAQTPAC